MGRNNSGVASSEWVKVSPVLLQYGQGHLHYCPGCENLHPLPDSWQFDGNVASPTYSPSFMQNRGAPSQCHYFIKAGQIEYCADSNHALAGKTLPMPALPDWATD